MEPASFTGSMRAAVAVVMPSSSLAVSDHSANTLSLCNRLDSPRDGVPFTHCGRGVGMPLLATSNLKLKWHGCPLANSSLQESDTGTVNVACPSSVRVSTLTRGDDAPAVDAWVDAPTPPSDTHASSAVELAVLAMRAPLMSRPDAGTDDWLRLRLNGVSGTSAASVADVRRRGGSADGSDGTTMHHRMSMREPHTRLPLLQRTTAGARIRGQQRSATRRRESQHRGNTPNTHLDRQPGHGDASLLKNSGRCSQRRQTGQQGSRRSACGEK
jgi:hypothetical protein